MTGFALFLARRLLGLAVMGWAATLAAFALMRIGVPNPGIDAQIARQLGPGQPASRQYLHYLGRLLHGNLGTSLSIPEPVTTVLREGLPPTLSLLLGGMLLWLLIGIAAGVTSALRPGSLADQLTSPGVLAGLAVPTFLLALLLLALSSQLAVDGHQWLRPGYVGISASPVDWLGRMILPWFAVAATQAGVTARLARAGIREVLGEDYVRTARAKGLDERRVLMWHVLRAAILPVVSGVAAGFGTVLGAAAIVDQVFGLDGIGQAFLGAVRSGDLPVVLGTVLAALVLVAAVNLITDIGYALLYPQVREW